MTRREKIESRLQAEPDDVFLNYTYAMELAKCGDVDASLAAFRKVQTLDANYVSAYFQEGQMLAQNDRVDDARESLQRGIEVARRVGDAHALGEMTEYLETL